MATAGRKRKPTALHVIQGTHRKDRANTREPRPVEDLEAPPDHFCAEQREVWEYAISHAPRGLLKMLDRSVLEVWVGAYVLHRAAVALALGDGPVVEAGNRGQIVNPALNAASKQAQIMLRAASELGFSPSSRPRISITDDAGEENPFARFTSRGA